MKTSWPGASAKTGTATRVAIPDLSHLLKHEDDGPRRLHGFEFEYLTTGPHTARRERERVVKGGGRGLGTVRVVRGVEQDHRAAADDLQPARRGGSRERLAHQVVAQGIVAEERVPEA